MLVEQVMIFFLWVGGSWVWKIVHWPVVKCARRPKPEFSALFKWFHPGFRPSAHILPPPCALQPTLPAPRRDLESQDVRIKLDIWLSGVLYARQKLRAQQGPIGFWNKNKEGNEEWLGGRRREPQGNFHDEIAAPSAVFPPAYLNSPRKGSCDTGECLQHLHFSTIEYDATKAIPLLTYAGGVGGGWKKGSVSFGVSGKTTLVRSIFPDQQS